jgi:hypothetical protein
VSTATTSAGTTRSTHLDPARARLLLQVTGGVAVLGVILAAIAAATDTKRFAFSYLTGFLFVVTLGLGGLFFVLIQHVTKAGWSVAPRRQMEWLTGILPIAAILFLPVAFLSSHIYDEWMNPTVAKLGKELFETIEKKQAYLNPTFFFIRAGLFFAAWTFLSYLFGRGSREQDVTGEVAITNKLQTWSAPALFVFGLTLTFASFDWIMSLKAEWYSTIFGVYIFSGSVTGSLALLALLTLALQATGLLGNVSTVEHRHDIGKLLFGFTIFWAYIGFSQFFLIWYANLPEETIFYAMRWGVTANPHGLYSTWRPVSLLLLFGHFWVPFFLLLSRHVKRSVMGLAIGATIMLVMHYVDIYWLVMPNLDQEFTPTWIDLAGLLAPLSILGVWLSFRASRDPLYPLRDPRLPEAAQLVNL